MFWTGPGSEPSLSSPSRHRCARQTSAAPAITCPRPLRRMIRFMGCHKNTRKLTQIRQNYRFPGMILSFLSNRDLHGAHSRCSSGSPVMLGKLPRHTAHHGELLGTVPAWLPSQHTHLPGPDEASRAGSLLRGSTRAPQGSLEGVWLPINRPLTCRLILWLPDCPSC